ncbi:MAG TPA: amidohydrolase [Limnochordales bacterium]
MVWLRPLLALPAAACWAGGAWHAPAAAALAAPAAPAPYHPADLVLLNGKVVTLDARSRIAQALAVRDGLIVAVGSNGEVLRWIGPETRVVDVGGRTVIPGLIDSHTHGLLAGLTYGAELSWASVTSLEQGLRLIAEMARRSPAGTWIVVGGGWHQDQFRERRGPTPQELDQVAPEHPVYVQHLGQYAVLNRRALLALGLASDSPDPPQGRLVRDAAGRLTGLVTGDWRTFAHLSSRIPRPSWDQQLAGTREYLRQLTRWGVTGIIDAGGVAPAAELYRPVAHLWASGQLPLRVRYLASAQTPGQEVEELARWAALLPAGFGDDMLRFLGFGEVLVWDAHDGDRFGQKMELLPDALERVEKVLRLAAERGYSVHLHASNDYTARQLLAILERVNREVPLGRLRWCVAHLEDGSEATLQRLRALGLAWCVQSRLYFQGERFRAALGDAAASRAPPIRAALQQDVVVAAGTDGPRLSPANPFVTMWWLLTGATVSGTALRGPDQVPTREEALRMFTLAGAWLSREEDRRGSLEVGKWADLAVLDRDVLTVPVEQVKDIESMLTVVGGRVVYAREWFQFLEQPAGRR